MLLAYATRLPDSIHSIPGQSFNHFFGENLINQMSIKNDETEDELPRARLPQEQLEWYFDSSALSNPHPANQIEVSFLAWARFASA